MICSVSPCLQFTATNCQFSLANGQSPSNEKNYKLNDLMSKKEINKICFLLTCYALYGDGNQGDFMRVYCQGVFFMGLIDL